MIQSKWVGVDIAKDKFDAAIKTNNQTFINRTFDNNQHGFELFNHWIQTHTNTSKVCLEATGHYGTPLAEYLYQQHICVCVENPIKIKHFARSLLTRNKNDTLDARVIQQYAASAKPKPFKPQSLTHKKMRGLVQLLDTLTKQQAALKCQQQTAQHKVVSQAFASTIRVIEKQKESLKQKINTLIEKHKTLSKQAALIQSIKGIGSLTTAYLLAYLPDIHSFSKAKQLAAFAGLSPKQHQSGHFKGQTHIAKLGNARLRKALYMPALSAMRYNKALQPFIQRLTNNRLSAKAIIVAIMRKLLHIIFGVIKSDKPFDAQILCPSLKEA